MSYDRHQLFRFFFAFVVILCAHISEGKSRSDTFITIFISTLYPSKKNAVYFVLRGKKNNAANLKVFCSSLWPSD